MAAKSDDQAYLFTVLKNATAMTVDWKGVATEVGSKHPGNCLTKFNAIMKREGLKLEKGAMISISDSPAKVSKAPKRPAKKVTKKKTSADTDDDEDDEPAAKVAKLDSGNGDSNNGEL